MNNVTVFENQNRSSVFTGILIFLLLFSNPAFTSASEIKIISQSRPLLHTFSEVKVCADSSGTIIPDSFAEMERVNSLLNNYDPNSEISKINLNAGGDYVQISEETMDVLNIAVKYAELSNGAFDFTVGPLIKFWGFEKDDPGVDADLPSLENMMKVKSLVGYKSLKFKVLKDKTDKKYFAKLSKSGMTIDVGAFSKGYAADAAMALIRKRGYKNALVSAGGTIVSSGRKPDQSKWRIGIRHPRKAGELLSYIELEDVAVSTSGDYEKYYKKDNKRINHIIDPRTGMPVDRHQSVTVIAATGVESDALSTALFVLDTEEGIDLIDRLKGVEALIVDHQGGIFMSKGWPQKTVVY